MNPLPFYARFESLLENGYKTATTRPKKYGEVGEKFQAFGATFELTFVERVTLGLVGDFFFRQEGFLHKEEFVECWKEIHPGAGWTPDKKVYLHVFKRVD